MTRPRRDRTERIKAAEKDLMDAIVRRECRLKGKCVVCSRRMRLLRYLVRLATGKAGKRWPVEKALSLPPHYCAAKHIQPSRGEKHE